MSPSARENYLAAEVTTATPQKLHLMLIEAAIRFCHRAREHWRSGEDGLAAEALIRAQEIVGEMLAGLNPQVDKDLVGRVAAEYLFVFRSLAEANLHHDEAKLAGALRVLEIERETWRQVCAELGAALPDPASTGESSFGGPSAPHVRPFGGFSDSLPAESAGGFSVDA